MRNYLRVRGEYLTAAEAAAPATELPPRARRIRRLVSTVLGPEGTTSACAENTFPPHLDEVAFWNYLRVRGEYKSCLLDVRFCLELPPRARRIP